ncbi:Sec-independent protein translocase subunit TatA [Pseudonocardia xishanensis]|uniref:Sec-independent protein translocase protein TatA n=1 Tax=Pseudonocardia xishanensis TaxID=630995 RepID=A0ABP8RXC5_9PSEU
MGELSAWHWIVVIAVFVLLFGARRLPDAARSLGRSTRILRAELRAEEPPSETSVASTGSAAAPPSTASPLPPAAQAETAAHAPEHGATAGLPTAAVPPATT